MLQAGLGSWPWTPASKKETNKHTNKQRSKRTNKQTIKQTKNKTKQKETKQTKENKQKETNQNKTKTKNNIKNKTRQKQKTKQNKAKQSKKHTSKQNKNKTKTNTNKETQKQMSANRNPFSIFPIIYVITLRFTNPSCLHFLATNGKDKAQLATCWASFGVSVWHWGAFSVAVGRGSRGVAAWHRPDCQAAALTATLPRVLPLLGAIARCHCSVLWLSGRGAIAGSVLWLWGRVTTNFEGVDVVPLQGAIALCFGWGEEWTWCHCWAPL